MNSLLSWFSRRRHEERERDLDRELRSHLEAEAERQQEAGYSAEEARCAAQRAFGNLAMATEDTRAAWGWAALDHLSHDVRFALRGLRKNSAYTAIAVFILALGIGANTAIFSAVNAALLRPLPFEQPERLVQVFHLAPKNVLGGGRFGVAVGNFVEWHAQQHSFDGLALYHFHGLNLTGGDRPDHVPGAEVSADFFPVLRVAPLLGRVFTPEEMQPGREREVVLSYEVWQAQFGGDPNVVGRTVSFDRQGYTVIGVMPDHFRFPSWAKLWLPAAWTAADRANRNNHNSTAIGRLRDGVSLEQAQAEMNAISRRLAETYPQEDAGWGAKVIPLHDNLVGNLRTPLLVLLGAVSLVLLIACSNVANLVLAKTLSRRKELAVRAALGASRARVLQLVLVETLLLALGGGALGLVLAHYGMAVITRYFGAGFSSSFDIRLDTTVLFFALGAAGLCGVLAGLLPAWRLAHNDADLHTALRQGLGRTDADGGGLHARSALVTVEVALTTVLLISAGLLLRTLWVLHSADPGFDPHQMVTMELPRPGRGDSTFMRQAIERARALPGVEAAGATSNIPLSGSGESSWSIQVEGQPPLPIAQQPDVATNVISAGYFATMRIPLLYGRDFNDGDTADRPRVVIISREMARQFWPNQDPVGKRLFVSWTEPDKPREVVGVVGDTKDRGLESLRPLAQMYVPMAQAPFAPDSLLLRSSLPASETVSAATRAIHELDRQQPVLDSGTMEHVIAASYSDRTANMELLAVFAGLALILAAAGIYGVVSYTVRRRLREIGIRMALGAKASDVLRMVVAEGLRPTIVGIVLGLITAALLGRVLTAMIYGVRTTDLGTYAVVVAALVAISVVACIVPASRATRVEPLTVLREE